MEYFKHLKFWNHSKEAENITEGLTLTQKKKYRKQYIRLAYNTFILSVVYILGIITLIGKLFSDGAIWTIVVVALIIRDYERLTYEWKNESELILERIQKRISKNKKQQNREVNTNE